ncbi:B9 domain-containing protein 1-like isoform X2 [Varroa jacobsoni]|uniref:B9 domain-containing protein 1 n=1 Tax=Varroa destructor TaxID=109461 RepID=A0A7M7JPV6_VARDE|nr:B9 domain-containing protein 1-like isoform X2 [Varroa destructor]XP_022696281.1 B9 domain-containing protein 1-like isoform X2 [Varroa jacobsoni]
MTMFPFIDNIYCKINVVHGKDWILCAGSEDDLTQVSRKTRGAGLNGGTTCSGSYFVFNHPLDVAYKFTNPYGWPQLVLSVFGLDALGNDVIRGYGTIHLPTMPGRHSVTVPLQAPESSTVAQWLSSLFTGKRPELSEPRVFADQHSRQLLRMYSEGLPYIEVVFNVALKDMDKFGFDVGANLAVNQGGSQLF